MKKYIIKLLFRLLENKETYKGINDAKIEEWLIDQHGNPGFLEYFRKRDLEILKAFGSLPEEKHYWILAGQRLELINMAGKMKREHEKNKKSK
jgi:hypothetical protein